MSADGVDDTAAAPSELTTRIGDVVARIGEAFGAGAEVRVEETGEEVAVTLQGAEASRIIGHHGATLDAVQHLATRIAFHGPAARKRITVDAAGYRAKRADALQSAADQAVLTVAESRHPVVLEAMSAAERRVVHEYLKDRPEIETYSQGDEPDRRLVVAPLVV